MAHRGINGDYDKADGRREGRGSMDRREGEGGEAGCKSGVIVERIRRFGVR